jgi:hypothetical protein
VPPVEVLGMPDDKGFNGQASSNALANWSLFTVRKRPLLMLLGSILPRRVIAYSTSARRHLDLRLRLLSTPLRSFCGRIGLDNLVRILTGSYPYLAAFGSPSNN